jgi:hypothetical protein
MQNKIGEIPRVSLTKTIQRKVHSMCFHPQTGVRYKTFVFSSSLIYFLKITDKYFEYLKTKSDRPFIRLLLKDSNIWSRQVSILELDMTYKYQTKERHV